MDAAVPLEDVRRRVSEAEWETRVTLAACYRLVAKYGMSDLVYNHITARVPGTQDHILINPYGFLYTEITASSLYKIDLAGNVVMQPDVGYEINRAGYVIHSAVHAARHDLNCVLHTHGRASMAVSAMKCGLLPITQTAMRFYGHVGYHDYEGPAIFEDEKKRLIANLGNNKVLMLRNHGVLACGETIPEAFNIVYFLENACRAQVDAMAAGADLNFPKKEVALQTRHLFETGPNGKPPGMDGAFEWKALIRQLEREDSSYRN
jgi:ribulose-5-phosphate 4-epimerase/fuculose-1-phosphate aldolase